MKGAWILFLQKQEPREINIDTFLPPDEDWRLLIKNQSINLFHNWMSIESK